MKVRTSEFKYMNYVKRYFSMLLPLLAALQFTSGGLLIAFQVENEYGFNPQKDLDYIQQLYQTTRKYGIKELLVTSDAPYMTMDFTQDWSETHHTLMNTTFHDIYESILKYPASINLYMFHGGTNWGFLNGANIGSGNNSYYQPTTTSYDYDAPLPEAGHLRDTVMVLINGVLTSTPLASSDNFNGFGYWRLENSYITSTSTNLVNATLDLIVENWGRGNFGNLCFQCKGLTENNQVYLNDEELLFWTMYPFEFRKSWTSNLDGWKPVKGDLQTGPALYKGTLSFAEDPTDTFINMQKWTKDVVIVNEFVLGRYALVGPQQTLYLPGSFLIKGDNEIIFEQFNAAKNTIFSADP
ncbi:Glyco hydro 35 domain containing protein, partial [Asbolus verrucosus]